MGALLTCNVTVTLVSMIATIPGLPPLLIPVGTELITSVPFPETGGEVTIDLFPLLGVEGTLTVPCPSETTEVVVVSPTLTANLLITVTESP
jgi:hypothetical protein